MTSNVECRAASMINTLRVIQGVSGTKTVSEVFGGCCKNCDDDEPGSLATFSMVARVSAIRTQWIADVVQFGTRLSDETGCCCNIIMAAIHARTRQTGPISQSPGPICSNFVGGRNPPNRVLIKKWRVLVDPNHLRGFRLVLEFWLVREGFVWCGCEVDTTHARSLRTLLFKRDSRTKARKTTIVVIA